MMLALHQIRVMHQDHGYDLIWGHYAYPSGFLACLAAREVGTASTVSIRGNDLDTALFSGQAFPIFSGPLNQLQRSHAFLLNTLSVSEA